MVKTRWLTLPTLIALVILPRLSIDLYLSSLPQMRESIEATEFALQLTLTIFMFGYALSMLISGPLSDVIGRKRVMLNGLFIYLLATLICATSNSILVLTVARFFQALGGCCGTVVARVMVRDSYNREEQIHILAYLSAAMAICPLFIPILGGELQIYLGWRSIFYFLAIFSLIMFIISKKQLDEAPSLRSSFSFNELINNYKNLLQNRLFIAYSLCIGLAWGCYFIFTLEAPFLIEKNLGLSTLSFGFIFSAVVLGYLVGTLVTKRFANQIGWDKLIFIAISLICIGAVLLLFLNWFFSLSWLILMVPMMVLMLGVGIIIPCTQAAVMQPFPTMAGTASGLFFFIQMIFSGVSGLLIQSFQDESATPMTIMIFIYSLLLIVSFYILVWNKRLRE